MDAKEKGDKVDFLIDDSLECDDFDFECLDDEDIDCSFEKAEIEE
jgi:hypothetical protein